MPRHHGRERGLFGRRARGHAGNNAWRLALQAAVWRHAHATLQIPRRASRSLTLVSEKRIIDPF
jgi:hypothetical protein